ncbi:MAG: leucyl/phenylalanyl-tRNA--protein transferase [Acidimicrobiales bacterium]
MPLEPPPSEWQMPDPRLADGDLVAVGADLRPGTILAAYRSGLFPMPVEGQLAWWSPDPRAILEPATLRVTKSLRRSGARFEIRVDTAFEDVIGACADPRRPGGWISGAIRAAYVELHRLGWAHSVEAWAGTTLAGGLYGVAIGGLFAGESMFHHQTDASKVALMGLVSLLGPDALVDVQWQTPHLQSLGVIEVPREAYLSRVEAALARPLPPAFAWPPPPR